MRKLLMLPCLLYLSLTMFAQVQGIQWKRIIGTEKNESIEKVIATQDGGYLLIGQEYTDGLDAQLLLVKTTSTGAVEWQKRYGGSGQEWGITGIATPDGGSLVMATTSTTDNTGGVTGHHGVDPAAVQIDDEHKDDIWLLKLNAAGDIIWTKTLGGSRWDWACDIIRTTDNNYLVAALTSSGDGDLTGIRRSPVAAWPTQDYWVFKIDENGNFLWQKSYGGTEHDVPSSIIETSDGYLVAGSTMSTDLDIQSPRHPPSSEADLWVIKIDKTGILLWEKIFGGNGEDEAVKITPYNGHFLLGAYTASNDGDIIGFNPNNENRFHDFWVLELDEAGVLLSQKTIGSPRNEYLADMVVDTDQNILLIGNSTPDPYPSGYYPAIVKLNAAKDILYENYPSALRGIEFSSALSIAKGTFIIAGLIGDHQYNVPEDHLYGGSDALLLQFGDINTITGKVFLDHNANGAQDAGEPLMSDIRVVSSKRNEHSASLTAAGIYANPVDTGSYTTKVYFNNPNYTVTPASAVTGFSTYFNTTTADFALTPLAGKNDLSAVLIPLTPARPGFQADYRIKVYNKGTTTLAPLVQLVRDQQQTVLASTPVANSTTGNTINWQLANLAPFDTATIDISVQLAAPPALNLGDTLKLYLLANSVAIDVTTADNADTLKQLVVGSFDPNDKTETHGGVITPAQISGADPLTYVIRFQNMGTDTAFAITVRDTLDSRLDWNTLEMIDASHSYQLNIEGNDKLTWQFNNIKLPDHNINEPASHGYIVYQIKPKPTVQLGDTIKNGASIYFDYNLPVLTNIEMTAVMSFATLPITMTSFRAVLNKATVDVKWETATEESVRHFEILRSADGVQFNTIGIVLPGKSSYLFKDNAPLTGNNYYRIKTVDLDGEVDYSPIAMVNIKSENSIIASIYPNPGNGSSVNIALKGVVKGNVTIQLLDQMGRALLTKQYRQDNNSMFKTALTLGQLPKGTYILKVMANDTVYTNTLLIH